MRDTKDLLRSLDEMPPPDIWAGVRFAPRSAGPDADLGGCRRPRPGPSPRRRVVIVLAALALVAVPFTALWLAFDSTSASKLQSPTESPTGLIAYSAYANGRWQLFTVRPDGTGASMIPIAGIPDDAIHPAWSPDGTQIVFDARTGGGSGAGGGDRDLYVVDADGSNLRRLTMSPGWNYLPSWSPDGSSIAYVHGDNGNDDIWVIGSDGTDPRRLTDVPGFDLQPAWSPDGNSIAFQSNRAGNPEIYVMAPDGSNLARLTRNASFDGSPAWSPDGQTLAFASDQDGPGVYQMRSDGSDVRKLADASQVGPIEATWSPDGSQIAFTSGSADGSSLRLSILDLASGRISPITASGDLCCPAWRIPTSLQSTVTTAVQVPDVTGLSLADARQSIESPLCL